MALYSKKEFASICMLKTKNLATYIGRNKVIVGADGKIDSENETNKHFFENRIALLVKKGSIPREKADLLLNGQTIPAKSGVKPDKNKVDRSEPLKKTAQNPQFKFPEEDSGASLSRSSKLDIEIKEQELSKKKYENELKERQLAKQRGELIPTDLVKHVFIQHSKSIATAFKNGTESLITSLVKKFNVPQENVGEIRVELIGVINNAIDDSIDISKDSISNIVSDFQEKRDVGQRS